MSQRIDDEDITEMLSSSQLNAYEFDMANKQPQTQYTRNTVQVTDSDEEQEKALISQMTDRVEQSNKKSPKISGNHSSFPQQQQPQQQQQQPVIINQQISNNIEISLINNNSQRMQPDVIEINNNLSPDSMLKATNTMKRQSKTHRRSINIIQRFQISPMLLDPNQQPQTIDITINNTNIDGLNRMSSLSEAVRRHSQRNPNGPSLLGDNLDLHPQITLDYDHQHKFPSHRVRQSEFIPKDYAEVSGDNSPKKKKRDRIISEVPHIVNLGELFADSKYKHHNSKKSKKSKQGSAFGDNPSYMKEDSARGAARDSISSRSKMKPSPRDQVNMLKSSATLSSIESKKSQMRPQPLQMQQLSGGRPLLHTITIEPFSPAFDKKLNISVAEQAQSGTLNEEDQYRSLTDRGLLNKEVKYDKNIEQTMLDRDEFEVGSHMAQKAANEDLEANPVILTHQNEENNEEELKHMQSGNSEKNLMETKILKNDARFADDICVDDAEKLRKLKNYTYFIILPDDSFKKKWDLFITFILLFTAVVTPYRLAFYDIDDIAWVVIDTVLDAGFALDIVLNFFMAYYDDSEDIVDNRKVIACRYVKRWFFIDVASVFPISQIMNTGNYSHLARIARLPKLYRLIKVFRLVRIMKIVKERNTLIKYVNDLLKLSAGFERLIFFVIISIVLIHICGCFWIIISKLTDEITSTWLFRCGYQDSDDIATYIASIYFVITTFTTVGFGDINATTIYERILAIILMIMGVISFQFSISSLSSMLSTIDSRNAQLREKLQTLNKIRRQYKIGFEFYRRLKMALKYDHSKNAAMQFGFLNELPQNLKIELSLIMHKEIIKKIFFFSGKPAHFIAFIGPLLKPLHVEDGTYIYKEKDPIEEIFFLIKGKAAFVHKDIKDSCYLIIESGYYFGEIDFVFQNNDGKRKFTVKAQENCELLTISKQDLAKVDADYEEIVADLFKNAQKRLRKTLIIKDESESYFLKKIIQPNRYSTGENQQIRRMATALGMRRQSLDQNPLPGEPASPSRPRNQLNQIDEEDEEEQVSDEIKTDSTFQEEKPKSTENKQYTEENNDDEDAIEEEDEDEDQSPASKQKATENDQLEESPNVQDEEENSNNNDEQKKEGEERNMKSNSNHVSRKSSCNKNNEDKQNKKSQSGNDEEEEKEEEQQNELLDNEIQYDKDKQKVQAGQTPDKSLDSLHCSMEKSSSSKSSFTTDKDFDKYVDEEEEVKEDTKRQGDKVESQSNMRSQKTHTPVKQIQVIGPDTPKKRVTLTPQIINKKLNEMSAKEKARSNSVSKKVDNKNNELETALKKGVAGEGKKKKDSTKVQLYRSRTNSMFPNKVLNLKKLRTPKRPSLSNQNLNKIEVPQIVGILTPNSNRDQHDIDTEELQSQQQQRQKSKFFHRKTMKEIKNFAIDVKRFDEEIKSSESKSTISVGTQIQQLEEYMPKVEVQNINDDIMREEMELFNVSMGGPVTPAHVSPYQSPVLQRKQQVRKSSIQVNSGTLLDKLKIGQSTNKLMPAIQRGVSNLVIENTLMKLASKGDRGSRRTSMLIQNAMPLIQPDAIREQNDKMLKEVGQESKDMYQSVQGRLNKLETTIGNIENTLQTLISQQQVQHQQQAPDTSQILQFLMGAITELNIEQSQLKDCI